MPFWKLWRLTCEDVPALPLQIAIGYGKGGEENEAHRDCGRSASWRHCAACYRRGQLLPLGLFPAALLLQWWVHLRQMRQGRHPVPCMHAYVYPLLIGTSAVGPWPGACRATGPRGLPEI